MSTPTMETVAAMSAMSEWDGVETGVVGAGEVSVRAMRRE